MIEQEKISSIEFELIRVYNSEKQQYKIKVVNKRINITNVSRETN